MIEIPESKWQYGDEQRGNAAHGSSIRFRFTIQPEPPQRTVVCEQADGLPCGERDRSENRGLFRQRSGGEPQDRCGGLTFHVRRKSPETKSGSCQVYLRERALREEDGIKRRTDGG